MRGAREPRRLLGKGALGATLTALTGAVSVNVSKIPTGCAIIVGPLSEPSLFQPSQFFVPLSGPPISLCCTKQFRSSAPAAQCAAIRVLRQTQYLHRAGAPFIMDCGLNSPFGVGGRKESSFIIIFIDGHKCFFALGPRERRTGT